MAAETAETIFGSYMAPTPTSPHEVVLRVTPLAQARVEAALERMRRFAELEQDWDSYGGTRVQPEAVLQALRLLAVVFNVRDDVTDPMVVPTSEGGIQLEWDRDGLHLEMEVRPSLEIDVYWERPDGQTWEGLLPNNQASLERFLERLD